MLYALLTVLGTTDRDIFFENGISFPLLNIKLPFIIFYLVVPIIIIALHFNAIYLYERHRELMKKHSKIKKFYESIPFGILDIAVLEKGFVRQILKFFIFSLVYMLPLIMLYIFWWRFNKYQNTYYSLLHLLYIALDTAIFSIIIQSTTKIRRKLFLIIFLIILYFFLYLPMFLAVLVQYAISNEQQAIEKIQKFVKDKYNISVIERIQKFLKNFVEDEDSLKEFIHTYYPHLELSGEYLTTYDYNQLKALQSLDKSKPLALLQPPLDLRNRSFKYANFNDAFLVRVNLEGANLYGVKMNHAKLQGANLALANLKDASLQFANLQKANMGGAKLQGASLQHAKLKEANMNNAYLQRAKLLHANLQKANLDDASFQCADLIDARMQEANMTHAKFTKANMRNAKLQKVDLQYAILYGAAMSGVQLQGAYMRSAKLVGASLDDANLQGADLRFADLRGVFLDSANLQGTNMLRADLRGADLANAKLQGAYMKDAKLQGVYIKKAELQGAQSCIEGYSNFIDRITHYVNKRSDLSCVHHHAMSQREKLDLQKTILSFKKYVLEQEIEPVIARIKKSTSALPDLKEAEIGSYTMEDAKKWIKGIKTP